jgi:tetratricopeptide (TPR) repeat protein
LRDALSAEALAIARRLEDPATLAYAVSARLSATMEPDDLDDRWALATELTEAEDKERAFEGHEQRTIVLLARGDLVGLRGELAALARLADELRQPSQLIWVAGAGATLAILEGRFAEAEQLVQRARTAGAGLSYDTLMYMRLLQFALRRELGQLDESVSDLEQAAEDDPTRPLFRCALALAHLELDNTGPGRGMFAELAADDFALVPVNNDWLLSAALLAETAARAEDADAAAILYDRLEPYGSLNVDTVELSTGSVARYLGLLASTFGDLDASDAHFADAVSMNERMGAYPWLAHAQDDYSVLLARRDGPGDRERARELAASALATYRRLTMERYAAAIIDRAGSSG